MNSLYNLALRQSSSIQSDLSLLESSSTANGASPSSITALSGQLAASLGALSKTVDDYEGMAKRELNTAKRQRALERVKKFREEEKELRNGFAAAKARAVDPQAAAASSSSSSTGNGSAYTGSSSTAASSSRLGAGTSADSPYSLHARNQSGYGSSPYSAQSPYRPGGAASSSSAYAGPGGGTVSIGLDEDASSDPRAAYRMNASAAAMFGSSTGSAREGQALREHSFIQQTEAQLDSFIAQGREVWSNLTEQRDILKGTQRRLRDVGVTMGLSRDVIGYIERRSTQDNIIFAVGAIFTLICFYYIYKWFG
ncbi:hypothetical protein FA10DRAFT_268066 [Acaromyces ingoldii]|uniref:Protein transport protein BOS1 n=1 Tax=Acaromyces ingoldii TaxID=215250 RepID=A0A316YP48_9BASI|nr:hypothetical protein FA10DRAFT_268066 [Acaromyces ingoldii]PWN89525.1 hypothetical protein FA10DRAFT_268066 [Acaromyces ingoldii]